MQFCDFETEEICNYENDLTANFTWIRNKAGTSSLTTGPSFDHTYQTSIGHYMYIEASSPRRPGKNILNIILFLIIDN